MRIWINLLLVFVLFTSVAFAEDAVKSKGVDKPAKLSKEDEDKINKLSQLYKEGAVFVVELKSIGALSGVSSKSQGKLGSSNTERREITDLKEFFPFEEGLMLTLDKEPGNEYLYVVRKESEEAPWKLIKAFKRNTKSKKQDALPLPGNELQSKANHMMKE